jgi:hypothetical protein
MLPLIAVLGIARAASHPSPSQTQPANQATIIQANSAKANSAKDTSGLFPGENLNCYSPRQLALLRVSNLEATGTSITAVRRSERGSQVPKGDH